MISLSGPDTAFCVLSFIGTAILLPIPFYVPASWKNVNFALLMFYMVTALIFTFCNTVIVNPFASWCHFVARWIALTNYGIVTSFMLAAARMYKQHCHEEKQIYSWHYMLLDGVLGVILPVLGCILQLFTQLNTIHFTLSDSGSAADACFPTSPERTTGMTFVDVPLMVVTLLGLVYSTLIFYGSRLPTRPMIFIYGLVMFLSIWGYRIAMMAIRVRGSPSLRSDYEFEGRWVTLFLTYVWAIMWGTTREAVVFYGVAVQTVMAWPARCAKSFSEWKGAAGKVVLPTPYVHPILPTSAPGSEDGEKLKSEKKGKKKFGKHTAGTILRPSRRTLMSQYDAMSFKDVGGLMTDAEQFPPLPATKEEKETHPSLVFPPPPPGNKTFNVSIPNITIQKPRSGSPEAYALQPMERSSTRSPSPQDVLSPQSTRKPNSPPKAKSRAHSKALPVAPALVAYPFTDASFLEMSTTPKEDKIPLMGSR